jgi:hypothetical protein
LAARGGEKPILLSDRQLGSRPCRHLKGRRTKSRTVKVRRKNKKALRTAGAFAPVELAMVRMDAVRWSLVQISPDRSDAATGAARSDDEAFFPLTAEWLLWRALQSFPRLPR